jgi:sugar phosphate isomerase/epimerase
MKNMLRRTFLAGSAALPAAMVSAAPTPRLGTDLFSLRSQKMSPFQYLDYCAKFGMKVVHFSEIQFLGGLDDANLKKVGEHARELGIELEIGMKSICPTSKMFDAKAGSAEEQLTRMIHAATVAQSKIVRAVLGSMEDRRAPVGIEANIEATVKVLRAVKPRAVDAGIKIAIENHAGDMQGRELKSLIEGAGPDFVGACLDSGNPLWTVEDPHLTLETLAPYVLTSHIRDSYVWATPEGAAVRWVRMGEGNIGMERYLRDYMDLCPGRAMSLEVIVTGPRIFPWRKPEFWEIYRRTPAWEFARFASLTESGKPQSGYVNPPRDRAAEVEREDYEASVRWTKEFLHI